MTHIRYPGPTPWPEIERHNELDLVNAHGAYSAAWDVWCDNKHMWRSYRPETGETVAAWAERELDPGVAANHDDGRWGISGVVNVDLYPTPTLRSVEEYPALRSIRDAGATYLALAQILGAEPFGYDLIPAEQTLYTKIRRAPDGQYIWKLFEPTSCVSVRGFIVHTDRNKPRDGEPRHAFCATLERRDDSRIDDDSSLSERETKITAPMRPNHAIRAAKRALGIPNWPAYRRDNRWVWLLVGAPYQVRIVIVDDSSAG